MVERLAVAAFRGAWALLCLGLAAPAWPADVTSARPDAVAVTIYRDRPARTVDLIRAGGADDHGLALVVETRAIDLPAGRSRLRLEGVADGIIPQSVSLEGLTARLVERNFDHDLMDPGTLIARSVGQDVRLVRASRETGRQSEIPAKLVSGPDGVMLDIGGRLEALHCGGESERLIFDHIPPDLSARPTVSVTVEAARAGRFQARLSYLTTRLDWSADYVARINPDGRTLDLTGWITLVNASAATFADAPTEVVAGHLARQPVDRSRTQPTSATAACWPGQTTHGGWLYPAPPPPPPPPPLQFRLAAPAAMATEVIVTAQKRVIESQLGDYKLYTLAEPTTVAARQTKQVLFLSRPAARFQTVYAHDVASFEWPWAPPIPARILLRLENRASEGLGAPLPAGGFSIRRRHAGGELFVGDYRLAGDVPVGEPFEIAAGEASDVTISQRTISDTGALKDGLARRRLRFEIAAMNAKATPVAVEIRHPRAGAAGFRVVSESQGHGLKAGDPVWRLVAPAGEAVTLSYEIETVTPASHRPRA